MRRIVSRSFLLVAFVLVIPLALAAAGYALVRAAATRPKVPLRTS